MGQLYAAAGGATVCSCSWGDCMQLQLGGDCMQLQVGRLYAAAGGATVCSCRVDSETSALCIVHLYVTYDPHNNQALLPYIPSNDWYF